MFDTHMRRAYDVLPDGVIVLDTAGRIIYGNAAAFSIFEGTTGSLDNQVIFDPLFHLVDEQLAEIASSKHPAARARRTGAPVASIICGVTLKGNVRKWLQLHTLPLRDASGSPDQLVLIFQDVTRQKTTELLLRTVVSCAPISLWAIDAGGNYTLSEGPFLDLYGYAPGDLVGRSIWDVLAHAPDQAADVQRALEGEEIVTTLEANDHVFETRYAILHDSLGKMEGLIGVTADITERVQAQRAAEELAAVRSDFVAAINHELRTPLTAVIGFSELLLAHWTRYTDDQRRQHLERILRATRRQQRLVEDLLELTQIEANTLEVGTEALAVASLVEQAAQEVHTVFPSQIIQIHGPVAAQLIGDVKRVTGILSILIDNAAKYSPDDRPVQVTWEVRQARTLVRVRDFGSGIPQEGLPLLFTRFGRMPGSSIRSGRVGTGLGLYIGRQLAQALQGTLDLERTGPDGSTFLLSLPAVSA